MLNKEDTNGINAMLAHRNRSGDDNNFVRNVIGSYMFLGFGVVTKIAGERMEVSCGDRSYTSVELMVLGVDGWGVKMVPAVNDRVLLISTQVPVYDLKLFVAAGKMPPYDQSGIKAIPLTDTTSAQLITVDKTGIKVTGANKLTIDANGVQLEDSNGNKVTTSSSGIVIEDKNGSGDKLNKITMSSTGVDITDKNGNTIACDNSNGVVINGNLQIKRSS